MSVHETEERPAEGLLHPESRSRPVVIRLGVLVVAAVVVLVGSTLAGQLVRNHHYAQMRPGVMAQCQAVQVVELTGKGGGDFTHLDAGPTTTVRHPDGSWTVIMRTTLSGHVENGVADGDRVAAKKTCDLSESAAGHKGARPGSVLINFDGPRGVSSQRFVLGRTGTYTGGGWGVVSS